MRTKRLLLATTALLACKKTEPVENPLPGNPKGSFYADAAIPDAGSGSGSAASAVTDAGPADAGSGSAATATADASIVVNDDVRPLPANPKGTFYDAGVHVVPKQPVDAAVRRPLPANPKGTHYDANVDDELANPFKK